jgi:hypothetical protein
MTMAAKNAPSVNPLNPLLYAFLEHKFGEVRIANEGVSAQVQPFNDPLRPGRVIKRGHSWGEYYCVCCPFCRDQRHRLWINHLYGADYHNGRRTDTNLAICYNADCLNKTPGRFEQLEDMIFGANRRVMLKAPIRQAQAEAAAVAVEPPGEVALLDTLPEFHPAIEYLVSRNFDIKELTTQFGVGVCTKPGQPRYQIMRGRIYIPIYFNRQLVGWQGRAVGEGTYGPKYYNAPGTPKSRVLYNYDAASSQPCVVVVEGVPSVWRLGVAGVCIFGKTLSLWQQTTIATTWANKPVFVMLDVDAQEELERAVSALCARDVNVVPVILPDSRDPADYSRPQLFELLSAAADAVDVTADLSFLL